MDILNKPIGIIYNNHEYTLDSLSYNIGTFNKEVGIYGNDIGYLCDFDFNSQIQPWFKCDGVKSSSDSYIQYVEDLYYNGSKQLVDFFSMDEKMSMYNPYELDTKFNHVGAIRSYNYLNKYSYGNVNPNSFSSDTKLGYINNFYLSNTINNTVLESFKKPSSNGMGITKGLYDKFSVGGEYGMIYGEFHKPFGFVENQNNIVGNTILVTNTNNLGITADNSLINSSISLIDSNTERTNNFITRSLLGMDLLLNPHDYLTLYQLDDNLIDYSKNKRYTPSYVHGNNTYIDTIAESFSVTEDGKMFSLKRVGVNVLNKDKRQKQYQEKEGGYIPNINAHYSDSDLNSGFDGNHRNDLINKTNQLFKEGKIGSLIGRFHSDKNDDEDSIISTSKSKYGYSRGRNLLKMGDSDRNGYNNPYCRVWTYDKQYQNLSDTIRNNEFNTELRTSDLLLKNRQMGKKQNGNELLRTYGVIGSNGLVKYNNTDKVKSCMFSIENLAWKDYKPMYDNLDEDQKGPNNGRIMWFPPYDLKFSENVNVRWDATSFIGRGEDIYTYVNTNRGGNLSFKLLVDHPSIIDNWKGSGYSDDVNDTHDGEQSLLRFFAGCDIYNANNTKGDNELKEIDRYLLNIDEQLPIATDTISFIVYFPNNYSGVGESISPIKYLYNGVGSNKYIDNIIDSNDYNINNTNDLYPNDNEKNTIKEISYIDGIEVETTFTVGGYEMGEKSLSNWVSDGKKYVLNDDKLLVPFHNVGDDKLWYRTDKDYRNDIFSLKTNYKDNICYKLNSTEYGKGVKVICNSENLDKYCSFKDAYDVINKKERNNKLYEIFNNHIIKGVKLHGYASKHGTKKANMELAKNRVKTIEKWLNSNSSFSLATFDYSYNEGPELINKDINSFEAKVWRCVKVDIEYETQRTDVLYDTMSDFYKNVENDELFIANLDINNDSQKKIEDYLKNVKKNNGNDKLTKERLNNIISLYKQKIIENDKAKERLRIIKKNDKKRYCDEYKFFEELKDNDPLIFKRITNKIKYFNPAFHSISPEGFQSRLTFLHQCTRQGNTIGLSDDKNKGNAYNLSFGRPPVCVLRIGDFFNTKIIIESLNIRYEDTNWDLNTEGIGVMPMIADVDITFRFIGGSDITGPIKKLQNALSFNYYANTSVYDDRATIKDDEINNINQQNK